MDSGIGTSELDILKSSHKFLRDDDNRQLTWDDRLAKKYYDSLYREFAVCDLKHYKSGNFALRWRTEAEVLSGTGEETCGNTRCPHHYPQGPEPIPPLTTLELPFAYSEQGQHKSALVKVVLCARCCNKLMWKRHKDKEREQERTNDRQDDMAGQAVSAPPAESSREPEERELEGRKIRQEFSTAIVPTARRKHLPSEEDGHGRSRETRNHDQLRTGASHSDHRRERERETRTDRGRMRSSRSRSPTSRRDARERRSRHRP